MLFIDTALREVRLLRSARNDSLFEFLREHQVYQQSRPNPHRNHFSIKL